MTSWKRKDGKGLHSLGALWFVVANKELKPTDYAKEANNLGVNLVNYFTEKKEIVDYFTGNIVESNQIDINIRNQTLLRKADIRSGKTLQAQQK